MKLDLRALRLRDWIIAIAFILAAAASVLFATRAVVQAVYWSTHREEPLQPWMTVGYVAHSYELPPDVLFAAIGLSPGERDRRPLADIAQARGVPVSTLMRTLEEAIAQARLPTDEPSR